MTARMKASVRISMMIYAITLPIFAILATVEWINHVDGSGGGSSGSAFWDSSTKVAVPATIVTFVLFVVLLWSFVRDWRGSHKIQPADEAHDCT